MGTFAGKNGRAAEAVGLGQPHCDRVYHRIAREFLDSGNYAVRDFAARCVEFNLATFIDLPAQNTIYFTNWNTPADVQSGRKSAD